MEVLVPDQVAIPPQHVGVFVEAEGRAVQNALATARISRNLANIMDAGPTDRI